MGTAVTDTSVVEVITKTLKDELKMDFTVVKMVDNPNIFIKPEYVLAGDLRAWFLGLCNGFEHDHDVTCIYLMPNHGKVAYGGGVTNQEGNC